MEHMWWLGLRARTVSVTAVVATVAIIAGGCSVSDSSPRDGGTTLASGPATTNWRPTTTLSPRVDPPAEVVLPAELPPDFAVMLAAPVSGTTYHVAINEPCASDTNDGLSASCLGGHGPWRTLSALASLPGPSAGDAVVLSDGIYPVDITGDGIRIRESISGTTESPIRFMAAEGAEVTLDGGFRAETWLASFDDLSMAATEWAGTYHNTHVLAIDADHVIVEGINITGCAYSCVQWRGTNSILVDSIIDGGVEDGIKTTYLGSEDSPSSHNLVLRNDFSGFGDQAIDAWGTSDFWVVGNHIHDSNPAINTGGQPGTPVWTKGGSRDVWYVENVFEDLTVRSHALDLGGCCWHNWSGEDSEGNLLPVASRVHAVRNELSRITTTADRTWDGAIGVEGCRDCEVRDNVMIDVTAALGVHDTRDGTNRMPTTGLVVEGNVVDGRVVGVGG